MRFVPLCLMLLPVLLFFTVYVKGRAGGFEDDHEAAQDVLDALGIPHKATELRSGDRQTVWNKAAVTSCVLLCLGAIYGVLLSFTILAACLHP